MYDVKYAPFADSYIGMAHGNGYEHLKHWLKRRLIFCDTLFDYAPSYNNDMLTIRANTTELMNIEIETYTPVYQHVSWYNGQMDKKKIDGKTAVSFSGTAMAETDQEVLIYGGSNIKKISGITSMNPNQMLIGSATRLSELSAPNCPLLADINSNKANLSPHTYLNKVDLSNCPQLGGILRLNNSQLVRDVDISGTTIDGLQLPANVRNLEVFKLSEDVANVTLRDAVLLKELNIPTNIEYLSLINVPSLTTITSNASSFEKLNTLIMENPKVNPISNIVEKAPNLQYVRLIGLDIACSVSQMQLLSNLKGIDSFGNEIPINQSVSGKVILTQCSEELEIQLKEMFPLVEFIITSYAKSYTVTFVDGDGNVLYIAQTLQNESAIYIGNTPTKTSTKQYNYEWVGWDKPLKPITSDCTLTATFNEVLRYYTIRFIYSDTLEVVSEQILAYGETITKPTITNNNYNAWTPVDNIVTGDIDFYTTYIPYPEDLSIFTFNKMTYNGETGYECILYANTDVKLPSYLIIPFEYEGLPVLAYSQTFTATHSEVNEVYFPEVIKFLGPAAFYGFSSITDIYLPNIIKFVSSGQSTTYGSTNQQFAYCSSLKSVKLPKLQELPYSNANKSAFRSCTNLEYVWLGSEDYPFKTWRKGSSGSTYTHFYGSTDKLQFINLITENGVESDVTTDYEIYSSVKQKIIYSKKPIEIYSDDNFDYLIIGDEEAKIIAYNGTATEVTIPNTVKNTPITALKDSLFCNSNVTTTLTSVTVPTTVTSLGIQCFSGCSALTSVTGLDNVISLGSQCFYDCSNLTEINLPNATSLSDNCFQGCFKLTSINLPLVTTIGGYCFQGCFNLTEIDLPLVTRLGANCFQSCTGLTEINIPLVTSLGISCFQSCSKLTSIELPKVTSLNDNCFYHCSGLTEINIPLVTAIAGNCFNGCSSLTSIDLPLVTRLGDYCFNSCSKLASINIPNVTSISRSCFSYCSSLTSVYLPNVTTVAANGFAQSGFKIITLPKLTRVTEQCFADARKLETVIIGSKEYPVTYIHSNKNTGDYAITTGTGKLMPFYYCSALKKAVFVTANGSLSDITLSYGNYVGTKSSSFAISNIYDITTNSIFQFVAKSFFLTEDSNFKYEVVDDKATITEYKGTATEIEIPSTVKGATITKIGKDVFYNSSVRTEITSVNLPNTVTSLGASCFYNCSNLTEINLPNVTSLGNSCFYGCSKLTSIELPNVTSLSTQCFYSCSNLTEIDLPKVTNIASRCFDGCINLTTIRGCQDLVTLGGFGNTKSSLACVNLKTVGEIDNEINLPSVTSMTTNAFYYCKSLGFINLPKLTSLSESAFQNAVLKGINIPLVNKLNIRCFYNADVSELHFPSVVSAIYDYAIMSSYVSKVVFGSVGNPITDTSNWATNFLSTDELIIYVSDPSNPPTLTGSPWGATNATITYEQA